MYMEILKALILFENSNNISLYSLVIKFSVEKNHTLSLLNHHDHIDSGLYLIARLLQLKINRLCNLGISYVRQLCTKQKWYPCLLPVVPYSCIHSPHHLLNVRGKIFIGFEQFFVLLNFNL
jgi:hypothetical protein